MRSRSLVAFTLAGAFALGLATAPAASAGVDDRQQHQRQRIRAGVQDGSLTRPEAHRLAHQQLRSERLEQRLRSDDGRLGPRERVRLDRRLDASSRHIYRARHDAQGR